MKTTNESHTDHGLTAAHLAMIDFHFEANPPKGFTIAQLDLPEGVESLPCGLHGPSTTGQEVPESEVQYAVRGTRKCASRLTSRPSAPSRKMTVMVALGEDGVPFLITAYGGPLAPREPGDPDIGSWDELVKSREFWSTHALSKE
jgi:hypothetical protein